MPETQRNGGKAMPTPTDANHTMEELKDESTMFFAEEIRKARLKLGENQTQFAKRFGVATNSISRYETGTYQAPYEIMLWVLMENKTIKDTSPASLDHANLAIDHLQKVIEELNKEKNQLLSERTKAIEEGRSEFKEIFENIIKNDKTPRYRYSGNRRYRADNRGELPESGRWLTPAEIAENVIKSLSPEKES